MGTMCAHTHTHTEQGFFLGGNVFKNSRNQQKFEFPAKFIDNKVDM